MLPYATQNTYGGPRGLQRLIDACHGVGLAVYLDVVFNHFGPESNYFGEFGPYFNDRYKTPWGSAINYDRGGCDAVREFVIDNVRMWLEEFYFDGLRLDAADMILDLGLHHILRAIKEVADLACGCRGWPAVVTAESDLNDPRLLYPDRCGGYALDAQWMDDFHHAVHAFLNGRTRSGTIAILVMAEQMVEVLEASVRLRGQLLLHSETVPLLAGGPGRRFIRRFRAEPRSGGKSRPGGEGPALSMKSLARNCCLAASYLSLSPYSPLLFMGEEYGEERPFPFFCSYQE